MKYADAYLSHIPQQGHDYDCPTDHSLTAAAQLEHSKHPKINDNIVQ